MKFIPVKTLPDLVSKSYRSEYKNRQTYLSKFLSLGVKYAKLAYDDYDCANAYSLKGSFQQAIKRTGYPIKICTVNNEVYFIRTDMEG